MWCTTGKQSPICSVNGDERLHPTADMYITVQGPTYVLAVGIANKLPYLVITQDDLPFLHDFFQSPQSCNAILTWVQETQSNEPDLTIAVMLFFDSELEVGQGKKNANPEDREGKNSSGQLFILKLSRLQRSW